MPDSTSLAILRDFAAFAVFAVTLGMIVYGFLRLRSHSLLPASEGGAVQSRHFSVPDVYVASLIMMLMLWGLDSQGADAGKPPPLPSLNLILTNIVFMLGLCVALLMYLAIMRGLNPAEVFGLRRLSGGRAFIAALVRILPLYVIVTIIAALIVNWAKDILPDIEPQETVKAFKSTQSFAAKAMMGVHAVIVAPLVEETVFRGFIYGVLKRYTDGWFAALCSSLLFAIVHMHLGSLVPLFVLALGLCAAYERTGSLLVPMWMHALFNGVSTTLLLLFPDGPK